ncbi:C25 family cysteine peptidase [Pontibacter liquoris]|uniref:putative type IX secretion system sortase PorU2 n=1 Tax=Pontibacter liquoris TaxID=2905677 RepID=UPI001FA6F243|nr:C25 family cysteine peptidase [Pontibacter liquoris]
MPSIKIIPVSYTAMRIFTLLPRFVLAVLLLLMGGYFGNASAQGKYGNEWINYAQTYYKIKVVNTGLHRLSYGYLDSLGLASVNPTQLQLFRRGKEVAIYVAGETDGKLDQQDFVEFYGERNDGALDRELYQNPAHQVHQLFSLYTDTAAYFLTINPAGGKRMREVNPSASGLSPEPYHLQKAVYANADRFNFGKLYDLDNRKTYMPWMDQGEGYMSNYSISPRTYDISGIVDVEQTGPKPRVEYGTVGAYQEQHTFDVNVASSGGYRKLATYNYDFFGSAKDTQPLDFSEISVQGKVTLQIVPVSTPTKGNAISFAYGIVTYPQKNTFTGNNLLFFTDSTRAATQYFEFPAASGGVVAYDVTNADAPIRISGQAIGAGKGFVINTGSSTRKVLLADAAKAFKPAKRGLRTTFRQLDPAKHNYIIITNQRLMKPAGGAAVPAPVAYAAYRASAAGGGYDTLLVTMDQVVNEFHYGEFSSNAIRHMMKFMAQSPREKQLFIIGKGVNYASASYLASIGKYSYYHVGARNPKVHEIDLVPTGIYPASDVFFTADFQNSSYVPQVPTGRLAATTPEQVIQYLNKVKEHEALSPVEPWRKNILQLGGGNTNLEINTIASFLRSYKQIAEGPLLGANVIEKYRQNVSEVVETVNVAEEVNNGVSLITFFGHSAPGTTDLDIGFASVAINGYKNKGKYPFMLMNGCNAGDAFVPNNTSFGEDWLQTAEKGAIGLIAHVDAGYPFQLNVYSSNFYTTAFQDPDFYGKPWGVVQQETAKRVLESTGNPINIAMIMEMVLQGDPALTLYTPAKPDYLFSGNAFEVTSDDNTTVTAATEKFNLVLGVNNLGKAITDSVYVKVRRTLSDNTVLEVDSIKVGPILNKGVIKVPLSNKGVAALGMNTFDVYLDSPNAVDEFNEDNNIGHFQHYFASSGLVTLSPSNFGIVTAAQVKLVAQATQAQQNQQGYYFEVDTTQAFNSNLKMTHTSEHALLPVWEVNLPGTGKDSTVYYWRVRFHNYAAGEDTVWASSSFRLIKNGHKGWSQSHYGQFSTTQTSKITQKGTQQIRWEFEPAAAETDVKTVGGDLRYTNPPYGIFFNGKMLYTASCSDPGGSATPRIFAIVVEDKGLTMVEKLGSGVACASAPYLYEFGHMGQAASQLKLENFLKSIPTGYHVVLATVNSVPFQNFSASLKTQFKSIGSTLIDGLKNGYPYGIVGQKGADPGAVQELTASTDDPTKPTAQPIALKVILKSKQPAGTLTSTVVGPALHWGTLYHNIERNGQGKDTYKLSIIGLDAAGNEQVLVDKVATKAFDLAAIDAKIYPNLKLRAFVSDSVARTAPQLKEWFAYYEPAPEGVIRPDLVKVSEQILNEQALQGRIALPMAFQNITDIPFPDSLTVEVTLTGENQQPIVSRFKIKPAGAFETVNFTYTLPTYSLAGSYRLSMFVNPRVQPEQEFFNNIYQVPVQLRNKLHPILDVAFDGVHILDGEIVSPSPLISIVVKDENRRQFLEDPSSMSVILIDPNGQEQEISLTNNPQEVRFYPADEKNDFKLEYKPAKLSDGKYTMEVRARDAAGKASGISPYRIGFEVISEASVTNFYPYPNPFSSKTQFIFTLTGGTIPEHMKIQILTVTGKVVKEIMKEEMGPLRIGNNRTAYAWDGTDTYGDQLANGVYLYRLVMSRIGEEMKHRNTFGDKAFKNGYGKLYILR